QRQWRRHCHRSSARRHRTSPSPDAGAGAEAVRHPLWHCLGLYRWRAGHCSPPRKSGGKLMEIRGKTAFVTGAASGLGAETARLLAANGARIGLFDRDVTKGQAMAGELGGQFFAVDVADANSAETAVTAAVSALGAPSILVNCAGIGTAARIVGRDGPM